MTDRDTFAAAALTDNRTPAAWLAVAADGSESSAVYMLREQADAAAREWGWMVVPLYLHPLAHAHRRGAGGDCRCD